MNDLAVRIKENPTLKVPVQAKIGRWLSPVLLFIVDYFTVVAALWSAYYVREDFLVFLYPQILPYHIPQHYINYVLPTIFLGFIAFEKMYTRRTPLWKSIASIFRVCTFSMIVVMGVFFFTGDIKEISRILVVLCWLFSFIYLVLARYMTKRMLTLVGLWQKPVLIIGAGKTAELLAETFDSDMNMGYNIIGLIEDHMKACPLTKKFPVLGKFSQIEEVVRMTGVRDVVIATPGLKREAMMDIVYRVQPLVDNIAVVPNLFGLPLGNLDAEGLLQQKAVILYVTNNLNRPYNRIFKYCFDMILTICGTIIAFPILVIIALAIYIDSPGPVIFAHKRVGANGKIFPCYKFRTMVVNAAEVLEQYLTSNPDARQEWEENFKLKNDPRVTRIGKWLRKTSLDELPQIINVLRGEMSLVGPRPIIEQEIGKYGEFINDYYLVRPGITGYWQVSGRSDVDYDERVQMDSWYVRSWSVWLDLVILARTVKIVFSCKGAY
ncbi:UDP-glucose:undecaprenyl-phosphate glucose-1-phosphate transferase [Sporomusa carbonis]|uniref:undecaprenyl-phosphate galactose phosphotransferase WbaP n=1 Tax=Sporomusa carbonis TaxID=3076075 RepID=UPI003A76A70C